MERYVRLQKVHDGIDAQPDLKSKKKYALSNSAFRSDPRDISVICLRSSYPDLKS